MQVRAVGAETVLARIIRLVEDAQAASADSAHGRQGGCRVRACGAVHALLTLLGWLWAGVGLETS